MLGITIYPNPKIGFGKNRGSFQKFPIQIFFLQNLFVYVVMRNSTSCSLSSKLFFWIILI